MTKSELLTLGSLSKTELEIESSREVIKPKKLERLLSVSHLKLTLSGLPKFLRFLIPSTDYQWVFGLTTSVLSINFYMPKLGCINSILDFYMQIQ